MLCLWRCWCRNLLLAVFVCRILREGDHLRSPRAQICQPGDHGNRRYQWTKDKLRCFVRGTVEHVLNALKELCPASRCTCGEDAHGPKLRELCPFRKRSRIWLCSSRC